MSHQQLRIIAMKTRAPIVCAQSAEKSQSAEKDIPTSCGGGAGFCRCWMPAWFRLAEIVAEERKTQATSANAEV